MITIDWPNKIIFVPLSYLSLVSPGIYELDVSQFRLDLVALQSDATGIAYDPTHDHITELTLSGTTYVRAVKIINGYQVEFESGSYSVKCTGANHNIGDVKVVNPVSLIINNSAGSTVVYVGGGGGLTTTDINAIDAAVDPSGKLKRRLVLQKGEDFDIEVETP